MKNFNNIREKITTQPHATFGFAVKSCPSMTSCRNATSCFVVNRATVTQKCIWRTRNAEIITTQPQSALRLGVKTQLFCTFLHFCLEIWEIKPYLCAVVLRKCCAEILKNSSMKSKIVVAESLLGDVVFYGSVSEAARAVGIDKSGISRAISGRQANAAGYRWSLRPRVLMLENGMTVEMTDGGGLASYPSGERIDFRSVDKSDLRFWDISEIVYRVRESDGTVDVLKEVVLYGC